MATPKRSQSSYLRIAASIFATIFLGFGVKFTLKPSDALDFFEFRAASSVADQRLVDTFVLLYAIRDVFMALALYAGAYFGDRKTLGWMLVASGGVAFGDGAVLKAQFGEGEWNHWGYAPMLVVVGGLLLGGSDRA